MTLQIYAELLSRPWMAAGAAAVIWTLVHITRLLLDPLHDIPGPIGARLSRIWYLRAVSKGNFEKTNIDLHRVHGMGLTSLRNRH